MTSPAEAVIPTPDVNQSVPHRNRVGTRRDCLQMALDVSMTSDTPDTIVEKAKKFEEYLYGEGDANA